MISVIRVTDPQGQPPIAVLAGARIRWLSGPQDCQGDYEVAGEPEGLDEPPGVNGKASLSRDGAPAHVDSGEKSDY